MTKVRQFQATTKTAYLLVPGFPDTLLPAGTALSVFGQLPNGRWRCCVQRPGTSAQLLVLDVEWLMVLFLTADEDDSDSSSLGE